MRRFPFTAGQVFSDLGVFFRSFFWFFFRVVFLFVFLWFWGAFGERFWSQNRHKIDPRWSKLGSRRLLKRYFLKNVNFHETSAGVMSGAFPGPQDGTQNDPRSPQDGSKTIFKSIFFRLRFCLRFWSVLVRFLPHLGLP